MSDPDVPLVAITATCMTPTVPLSKPILRVPVCTPGDSAERSAAIEIDALPGSTGPLAGDALSQPVPFDVKTVSGVVDRGVGRIEKANLLLLRRCTAGGTGEDNAAGRDS